MGDNLAGGKSARCEIAPRARRYILSPMWASLRPRLPILLIRVFLLVEILLALITGRVTTSFIAMATLGLTLLPGLFASRLHIKLPIGFLTAAVVFIFATIYLGEQADFYDKYWWWDLALHFGSAMGFSMLGFLLVFTMFEGDRYAAPPIAISTMAFCLAVTIGAIWEIFEFGMDQAFGLNMQKSGLDDTMSDLIVDCVGAALGAASGFVYLKGRPYRGLALLIDQFIRLNRRYFRKARDEG